MPADTAAVRQEKQEFQKPLQEILMVRRPDVGHPAFRADFVIAKHSEAVYGTNTLLRSYNNSAAICSKPEGVIK